MSRIDQPWDSLPDAYKRLHHPDRSQLVFQVGEIVVRETYLQGGIELRPGATVLDVGANVGVAATFFAEHGAGAIHCFEPVEPIRELLERNLAPIDRCIVHPYGLAARSARATITYYPNADAMSGLFADPERDSALAEQCIRNVGFEPAAAAEAVRERYRPEALTCDLRTLSSTLAEEAIEVVDLLKVDVERAELEVLSGIDEEDWPRIRQVVAEVHDQGDRVETIHSLLRRRGFNVVVGQDSGMSGTDVHMLYARREARP